MCNRKIKINILKKEAFITQLYSIECLEFMLGINTVIPKINHEFSKREEKFNLQKNYFYTIQLYI